MNMSELAQMVEGRGVDGAEKALRTVFEAIAGGLACGEKVAIRGFGKFEPAERKARTARNPRTGEEVEVAAQVSVRFTPSVLLKQRLNRVRPKAASG